MQLRELDKVNSIQQRGKKSARGRQGPAVREKGAPFPAPVFSDNALMVLRKRYLKKDEAGNPVESPVEMFWRVAETVARADSLYEKEPDAEKTRFEFFRMLSHLEFLPNSPTLMNAGSKLGQLSACFVLPVEDSMESIFEAIKSTAVIHKSGGGTGFSFSHIRPRNDMVLSTRGISSGPISFMTVFDAATETIKQGGTRRGANMGVLRVDHPDILEFINAKEQTDRLKNFNLSVVLTDAFMEAVENNDEYDVVNPRTGQASCRYNAAEVFTRIIEGAWRNGEPGILFIDRINRDNATPELGPIEATNPCGEQPLLPYESCNLGSINLARMVRDGEIDSGQLCRVVRSAVHFLDNVIDVNHYPLPEIERMTKGNRKIGLGVMGFADLLLQLEIPYDSDEAVEVAESVMREIREEARQASCALAARRGPFPNYCGGGMEGDGAPRNATNTTIAPTGTISIIAGCSSGIEPLFAISFVRRVMDDARLVEVNPHFKAVALREGFYSEALMKRIAGAGTLREIESVPEYWRRLFATAHDIDPDWHVRIQAAFQKHTDNSVSKTVNFRASATREDVERVYRLAYRLGCKGVTIYRDRSREAQVINIGSTARPAHEAATHAIKPRPRSAVTTGATRKMETGCGDLYVTINQDDEGLPFEIFNQMGKAGGCAASQSEAIGRLVSLALRSGIELPAVIRQLQGISCHKPRGIGSEKVLSCADAIARALWLHQEESIAEARGTAGTGDLESGEENLLGACPDCGGPVEHEGGCVVCRACGYSECM